MLLKFTTLVGFSLLRCYRLYVCVFLGALSVGFWLRGGGGDKVCNFSQKIFKGFRFFVKDEDREISCIRFFFFFFISVVSVF